MRAVHIVDGDWPTLREHAMPVRLEVFVNEQRVPIELEQDAEDPAAHHWIALCGERCVGTVRLTSSGHLGRLAVLPPWRRQGIGALLTGVVVDYARSSGARSVDLNAQVHAIPFYERLGFVVDSDEFLEAGIPHRHMRLDGGQT